MSPFSGFVLFAVFWFMVLFVVLPLRLQTQGENKNVVPGTPSSAPSEFHVVRKLKLVTLISVVLWGITTAVILSGVITVRDFDIFNRMGPAVTDETGG
ncbi:MAG: DUF1467 family protein [Paracoccaceae bacterium]